LGDDVTLRAKFDGLVVQQINLFPLHYTKAGRIVAYPTKSWPVVVQLVLGKFSDV